MTPDQFYEEIKKKASSLICIEPEHPLVKDAEIYIIISNGNKKSWLEAFQMKVIKKQLIYTFIIFTASIITHPAHAMLKRSVRPIAQPIARGATFAFEEASPFLRRTPRPLTITQPVRRFTTQWEKEAEKQIFTQVGKGGIPFKNVALAIAATSLPILLYVNTLPVAQAETPSYAAYFEKPTKNIYHAMPEVCSESPLNFGGLLEDMSVYLTTNVGWHQGNLYEHSIWVAKSIEKWFAESHFLVEGITDEKSKKITVIAGLLHDIGKAGNPDRRIFHNKPNHSLDGINYLLCKQPYIMIESGKSFDFQQYFDHIRATYNLDEEDIKKIIFLVGAHYAFGAQILKPIHRHDLKYYNKDIHTDEKEKIATKMNLLSKNFMQDLKQIAQEVGIKEVDESSVRLAILIGAADLYGSGEVSADSVIIPGIKNIPASHFFDEKHKEHLPKNYTSPYERKEVAKKGAFARRWILEKFKDK